MTGLFTPLSSAMIPNLDSMLQPMFVDMNPYFGNSGIPRLPSFIGAGSMQNPQIPIIQPGTMPGWQQQFNMINGLGGGGGEAAQVSGLGGGGGEAAQVSGRDDLSSLFDSLFADDGSGDGDVVYSDDGGGDFDLSGIYDSLNNLDLSG
jgi:hypothetical protein